MREINCFALNLCIGIISLIIIRNIISDREEQRKPGFRALVQRSKGFIIMPVLLSSYFSTFISLIRQCVPLTLTLLTLKPPNSAEFRGP